MEATRVTREGETAAVGLEETRGHSCPHSTIIRHQPRRGKIWAKRASIFKTTGRLVKQFPLTFRFASR